MSDERDLQDWFERSTEALPPEPFTLAVLERVQRRERRLRWQLYAARLTLFSSCCLLLPELIAPLNRLATLPLTLVAVGGAQWPLLVLVAAGAAYVAARYARQAGFFRRG